MKEGGKNEGRNEGRKEGSHLQQQLVLHDALHGFDEQVGQHEAVAHLLAQLLEEVDVLGDDELRLGFVLTVLDVHVQPLLLQVHADSTQH